MSKREELYYGQADNVLQMILVAQEWHRLVNEASAITPEVIDKGQDLVALMLEYKPRAVNRTSWPADVRSFNELLTAFAEMERLDGLVQLASDWWGIFHPTYKKACGIMRNRCTRASDSGDCDYKFPNRGIVICPECNAPRSMCSGPPSTADGRCLTHGVSKLANHRTSTSIQRGRAEAYKQAMIPDMQHSYDTIMGDPSYLSLLGEIGLIGSRNTRLLQDMEEFDPVESKSRIQTALGRIELAVDRIKAGVSKPDDFGKIETEMNSIQALLEDADRQERRWSEIKSNARTMAALVDSERRLLVDLQMMVTKPELEMMNTQVVAAITSMATRTGADIEDALLTWMGRRLEPDVFSLFKTAVSSVSIAAKTKRLILTNIEEALRRGEETRGIQDEYDTIEGHVSD